MVSENANASETKSASMSADAQIAAHRELHQQKIKKVAAIITITLFVVVGAFAAVQVISNTPNTGNTGNTAQDTQANQTTQQDSSLSDSQITEYREAFKQALTDYEINTQPNIDKILLTDWETQNATELALLKEQTLTAFAQGSFLQANQLFEKLQKDAEALIEKWQTETDNYLSLASKAFEDDQIPLAQLNLNKALALMPTNRQAIALQTRIDAYAEVATLLSDLEVAKVENNLPKQIDLLSGIIELDPQRSELNVDLEQVQTNYDKQQLAKLLKDAELAVSKNQLTQAQTLINKAQRIKPDSKGAKALSDKINQMRAGNTLADTKKQLSMLKENDDWEPVTLLASVSLLTHPNDVELQTYQQEALAVLQAKKSLQLFIDRPDRIADENIRTAASKAVQNAFAPSLMSPSLQSQIAQVAKSIDEYSEPVKVTVNSDGKTYVIVIGVGHVGQHKQKEIELMPGEYVLQGRREGYRNKRIPFTVKANTPIELSLICDEKI